MPRDVWTHWNLTYDMLQFALGYKDAIKMITSDLANGLQKYKLNDNKWLIVKELAATLKVWFHHNLSCSHVNQFNQCLPSCITHHISLTPQILKDGTKFFLWGSPNLAAVIPAMDHINKDFTTKTQPNTQLFDMPSHSPRRLLTGTTHWQMSLRSIELQWASLN